MVRFGILGAGNIARRFAASLAFEQDAELVAASCRTQEKAQAFLGEVPHAHGARAHGGHEALVADPNIDAIYLALPHAYHHEWALAALRAGKAVLCEKPAMLTAQQLAEVGAVAREHGVLFMEAMKPRFVPLYQEVMDALPRIGAIRRVEASLCNDMLSFVEGSGSYHMSPGPGAGVLLDCGTYCASWIDALSPDGAPKLVSATGQWRSGIDVYVDATLECGGQAARLECAFDRAKLRQATIVGEHGTLTVDELHRPQHATLTLDGAQPVELAVPYEHDDFYGQIHHFVSLLAQGKTESPIMPLAASLRCAQILDAIRAGL